MADRGIAGLFTWGLRVDDFWRGVLAALIISVINGVFGLILRRDTDRGRRRRLARSR